MSKANELSPNPQFGILSIILMFVPVLSVIVLSFILEPLVRNLSVTTQRIISVLVLLLPAVLGFIFAIAGLIKKERKKWLHVIGLIFNLLESLYFGLLVLIAG